MSAEEQWSSCKVPRIEANVSSDLANTLPLEIKLFILELAGNDVYGAVTGDSERVGTLLLRQRQYKQYFATRPFDYCPVRDNKLACHLKRTQSIAPTDLIRLPLLADRLFETYLKTQSESYVMADDELLKSFLCNANTTHLPLLIYGNFDAYKKAMPSEYDETKDTLLLQYLGTTADKVSECLKRLIDFDVSIKNVNESPYISCKIFSMRNISSVPFYAYLRQHDITVPECLLPKNVSKTLITYTRCFEYASLALAEECKRCYEPGVKRKVGEKFIQSSDWNDLYIIIFCSNCAYCMLSLPFE